MTGVTPGSGGVVSCAANMLKEPVKKSMGWRRVGPFLNVTTVHKSTSADHLVATRPSKSQNVLRICFTIKTKTLKTISDCLVPSTFLGHIYRS